MSEQLFACGRYAQPTGGASSDAFCRSAPPKQPALQVPRKRNVPASPAITTSSHSDEASCVVCGVTELPSPAHATPCRWWKGTGAPAATAPAYQPRRLVEILGVRRGADEQCFLVRARPRSSSSFRMDALARHCV